MSMGHRQKESQGERFVTHQELPKSKIHPFYARLTALLGQEDFDGFAETSRKGFYAQAMGRPSMPPGVYSRMLLIGYFEGIDSERGTACRCRDPLSLRESLGYGLSGKLPDHSILSRMPRLIDIETHDAVFVRFLLTARELCLRIRDHAGDITDIYRETPADRTAARQTKLRKGIAKFLEQERAYTTPSTATG